jgi:hypothetical protein
MKDWGRASPRLWGAAMRGGGSRADLHGVVDGHAGRHGPAGRVDCRAGAEAVHRREGPRMAADGGYECAASRKLSVQVRQGDDRDWEINK